MAVDRRKREGSAPGVAVGLVGTAAFAAVLAALWLAHEAAAAGTPSTPDFLVAAGAAAILGYASFLVALIHARTERAGRRAAEASRDLAERRLADFANPADEWLWETDRGLRFNWLSTRLE